VKENIAVGVYYYYYYAVWVVKQAASRWWFIYKSSWILWKICRILY